MSDGINLSIREYRDLVIKQMPPWMEVSDPDLLNYFSLSAFTYIDKIESIIVDGAEYIKTEWTLGDFKDDLGILGTGNYDNCIIDIIEDIDSDDNVHIYTNPNLIMVDAMATILKKVDDRRNQLFTEINPRLATVDGLLSFWEAIFQSERLTIQGELETDAAYMARAISELFGQSASLISVRQNFEKYGLTNFTLVNAREDTGTWDSFSESNTVHLYLQIEDFGRIPFLRQVWINISLAGMRLFIFCPDPEQDCYGLNYGNAKNYGDDYVEPPPFTPT